MSKTAIAIRHVHFEDLGAFDRVLRRHGYAVGHCDAGIDDVGNVDPVAPDLVILLGGPISAYEESLYPFLRHEIALLERRLGAARPTLGICLGARVYPAPAKEIGWGELQMSEAGRAGPLRHLAGVPVLHWHGDTFDLPEGAKLLASTEICSNQAFALGRHVFASQFHPEVSGHGFEHWLVGHAVELAAAGVSPTALRRDTERLAPASAARGEACLSEWLGGLYRGRQ